MNMKFTGVGGTGQTIPRVVDASACTDAAGGWYYDEPSDPATIRLCDSTCSVVTQARSGATLDVEYGCQSEFDVR